MESNQFFEKFSDWFYADCQDFLIGKIVFHWFVL